MPGLQFSSEAARVGDFPDNSNLPDPVVDLANLAMDPLYDVPDPADQGVLSGGTSPINSSAAALDFRQQPTFADGGMIGPGGMPVRGPGLAEPGAVSGGVTPELMQQEVRRLVQQNPEGVAQIQSAVMQALQSGDLTPDELNMIAQLALAAAQNPEVYPQVRQFAIQQGLATEADLPMEYDAGLVFTLLLVVQAAQAQLGGQPMSAGQPPVMSMANGGALPENSPNSDGSIKINAHEGEVVMTKAAKDYYGMKFFDKLERDAQEAMGGNGQTKS